MYAKIAYRGGGGSKMAKMLRTYYMDASLWNEIGTKLDKMMTCVKMTKIDCYNGIQHH